MAVPWEAHAATTADRANTLRPSATVPCMTQVAFGLVQPRKAAGLEVAPPPSARPASAPPPRAGPSRHAGAISSAASRLDIARQADPKPCRAAARRNFSVNSAVYEKRGPRIHRTGQPSSLRGLHGPSGDARYCRDITFHGRWRLTLLRKCAWFREALRCFPRKCAHGALNLGPSQHRQSSRASHRIATHEQGHARRAGATRWQPKPKRKPSYF